MFKTLLASCGLIAQQALAETNPPPPPTPEKSGVNFNVVGDFGWV